MQGGGLGGGEATVGKGVYGSGRRVEGGGGGGGQGDGEQGARLTVYCR